MKPVDATVGKSTNDIEDYVLTVSLGDEKLDWIIDFGCSYHKCANKKEYFATYEQVALDRVQWKNKIHIANPN